MIYEFREDTRWLSNFAPVDIKIGPYVFASVENAYMSLRNDSVEWLKICLSHSPAEVKRKSKEIKDDIGWDDRKISAMRICLEKKFAQEPYFTKLIETGDQNIQEGNLWKDKFWGVDLSESPNVGENHLGRLIMQIRKEIKYS